MHPGRVAQQRGNSGGAARTVHGDDQAIHTVLQLAAGGSVVRDDDRLSEKLRLPHGDGLALIARGLHIQVAGAHIGVGVVFLAEDDDAILHTGFGNFLANQHLVTAIADEIPRYVKAVRYQAAASSVERSKVSAA